MKDLTQQATKVVDLYKGEEPKRYVTLPEEEYGVCSICGTALGRFDVGISHSVCEQSMFLGDNKDLFY